MNIKILAGLLALAFVCAGCVRTVTGRNAVGVPTMKDTVYGNYEKPLDQVFEAAKEVIRFNGALLNEGIVHNETNMVKTVTGRVNQRSVWVRVEQLEPKITGVSVQTRTQGGGTDLNLAHEIEKQIALKLVR